LRVVPGHQLVRVHEADPGAERVGQPPGVLDGPRRLLALVHGDQDPAERAGGRADLDVRLAPLGGVTHGVLPSRHPSQAPTVESVVAPTPGDNPGVGNIWGRKKPPRRRLKSYGTARAFPHGLPFA